VTIPSDSTYEYDWSGTAALQNESYLFDEMGNLTQRQNNNVGLTENFYYDDVYRLDHSSLNGTVNLQMSYSAAGNITSRSDLAGGATWTYDASHRHAVTQAGSAGNSYTYDANGNANTRNGQGITWTSYNHPLVINNSGSGESVQFTYAHNHTRWRAVYGGSSGLETTYFIGGLMEKVSGVGGLFDFRHFVYAGNTKVAICSRTTGGANTLRYIREDHQESVASILNSDGTTYVKESFTAFGARRSACIWSGPPTNAALAKMNTVTRHGYTWQSALGGMGLNDMNGRIQDAVTGRFLSPDPIIQNLFNTQNFNRYSYVNNNPLTYVDPSGFEAESSEQAAVKPPAPSRQSPSTTIGKVRQRLRPVRRRLALALLAVVEAARATVATYRRSSSMALVLRHRHRWPGSFGASSMTHSSLLTSADFHRTSIQCLTDAPSRLIQALSLRGVKFTQK
jgi:RHS repeat-associated protein